MKRLIRKASDEIITTLYAVETTFLGAGSSNKFYFDDFNKVQKFIDEECDNYDLSKVIFKSDYELNYWDGCTLNDLTYGNFDAKIVKEQYY